MSVSKEKYLPISLELFYISHFYINLTLFMSNEQQETKSTILKSED